LALLGLAPSGGWASALAAVPRPWTPPTETYVRDLLARIVDKKRLCVGIVVGLIGPEGRRIVAHGPFDPRDPRLLSHDTEFEIGSITKAFTGLLLADMVQRGEVRLDDPAQALAPPGRTLPIAGGRSITLLDLATHTSGLPRLPANLRRGDPANPYADYTTQDLYDFLASYRLPRAPGASWEYSNLGAGLLGDLLARRSGASFEQVVADRILRPRGRWDTAVTLTASQAARLAPGHDAELRRVEGWDIPALVGAGGLKSTADDMLKFVAANLGGAPASLRTAMAAQLLSTRPGPAPSVRQGLGWALSSGGRLVNHEGGTGGYRTYAAFDTQTRRGIVVMINTAPEFDPDDLGDHLLMGAPLPPELTA